ncbi:hypothetical protein MMC30_002359 [Trapelia coarctata]|nr:hypothetical protein [Trapelia coarctata]
MTLSTVMTIAPKLRLVLPNQDKQSLDVKAKGKQTQDAKPQDKQSHDAKPTDQQSHDAKPTDVITPCGFLKLPGEIKNQIYELVFDPCDYEIIWLKKRRTLTHLIYNVDRRDLDQTKAWGTSHLSTRTRIPKLFTAPALGPNAAANRRLLHKPRNSRPHLEASLDRAHTRAALLLTCRAIHNEAVSMFYGAQSFGFSSRRLLEKFFSTISPIAKASITRLFLQHETYGDPYFVADIPWKTLHDAKWAASCAKMGSELVSLKELHLHLRINDHPLQLNLAAGWVDPLRYFADKGLKVLGLELLVGKLNSNTTSNLKSCAPVVREVILGCEYDEAADERKRLAIEFPVQVRPKALKVLRIVWSVITLSYKQALLIHVQNTRWLGLWSCSFNSPLQH